MSTPTRVAAFGALLLTTFAASLGLGSLVGPVGAATRPAPAGQVSTRPASGGTAPVPASAPEEEDHGHGG